jgi:hypothetical protein
MDQSHCVISIQDEGIEPERKDHLQLDQVGKSKGFVVVWVVCTGKLVLTGTI